MISFNFFQLSFTFFGLCQNPEILLRFISLTLVTSQFRFKDYPVFKQIVVAVFTNMYCLCILYFTTAGNKQKPHVYNTLNMDFEKIAFVLFFPPPKKCHNFGLKGQNKIS